MIPRRGSVAAVLGLLVIACTGGATPSPASPSVTASGSPTHASPEPAASTLAPSSSPEPAVLVGAGDIASCGSNADKATAALLATIDGTVFTAGDNAYDSGSALEFVRCYEPTWGAALDRTLPAPGNHEYVTKGAAGYFHYFGAAAGDPSQGWYARDVGTWRVYVLNSNCWAVGGCDSGSPQVRWLRDDLAANPWACTLGIWHHPLFSSGPHGANITTRPLWQALADAGAEIVVNGHDHDYERFAPQTAAGKADPSGIVEFVVGTGGRSHYAIEKTVANSAAHDDDTFGVIEFRLYADRWSFQFLPVAGSTFTDSGSGTCH